MVDEDPTAERDPGRDWVNHTTRRTLYSMSRTYAFDVLLTVYFAGALVASGIMGLMTSPGELGTILYGLRGDLVATAYSWGMILVGTSGIIARLFDSRRGESYAITAAAFLTLVNGVLLLPEHPQTALRLLFAPAMMVPYGLMRLGYTINRQQVHSLREAITAAQDDETQEPG